MDPKRATPAHAAEISGILSRTCPDLRFRVAKNRGSMRGTIFVGLHKRSAPASAEDCAKIARALMAGGFDSWLRNAGLGLEHRADRADRGISAEINFSIHKVGA